MKYYKEFCKKFIGSTDIARIKVMTNWENYDIQTGADDSYSAYWIDGEAEIGHHYSLLKEIKRVTWLVVADEIDITILEKYDNEKTLKIYRAGEHGYIFQLLDE